MTLRQNAGLSTLIEVFRDETCRRSVIDFRRFERRNQLRLQGSFFILLWNVLPTDKKNTRYEGNVCLRPCYQRLAVSHISLSFRMQNWTKSVRRFIVSAILIPIIYPYLLTHSMVQSPSWESNWFAASQEIPRISRNPKVHYRTHKRPSPVCILGQPKPVHIPTPTSWRSILI